MNWKRNPWENSLLENNFISLLESEKRTTASEENCLETFRWKTFRKNLAAYEKQKRKIAESYPLLSESHHLTKSDDEGFFTFFRRLPVPMPLLRGFPSASAKSPCLPAFCWPLIRVLKLMLSERKRTRLIN